MTFLLQLLAATAVYFAVIGEAVDVCSQLGQVNNFIGSGGLGFGYGGINPGANYPYSVMRMGPDTTNSIIDISYRHFSGYHYQDTKVRAFSHTHLVGAGVNDLGTFGITAKSGGGKARLDEDEPKYQGWWSTFNKTNENASPGYYSVHLDDPNVDAELLSVGTFAGVHRYKFKGSDASSERVDSLIIDVCHAAKLDLKDNTCKNATIAFDSENPNVFRASVYFAGGLSGWRWYYLYGVITTSDQKNPQAHWTTCTGLYPIPGKSCSSKSPNAESSTGFLFSEGKFTHAVDSASKDFTVEVRVGLSRIDAATAELNLQDAIPDMSISFPELKARTEQYWCEQLKHLQVEVLPGDEDLATMMYSSFYRTYISVADYTEHGGIYPGMDEVLRNVTAERAVSQSASSEAARFFSDFSLWDTFRTLQPWVLLTNEDLAVGLARSMADITVQQQAFPRWTLGNHESSCMLGESGASFILDMALSGYGDQFDLASVQRYLALQSTQPWPVNGRTDVEHYLSAGYVSQEASDTATSMTLTFAYDDYLLGKLSDMVSDTATAQAALQRSTNYRNVWSPLKQFFCPKYASGEMDCAMTGYAPETWKTFREGDALHWAWFVPHDVEGLRGLFATPDAFDAALEDFFVNHVPYHEKFGSAVPNPYYWAGNEHDFLAPYLFNYGPDCTKTQYWTRRLTQMHFSNTPHGIPGNDDYGSMATWLMFSSLGLFPQAGLNRYLLTSPRVQSATINLRRYNSDLPSKLVIKTYNNSDANVFVQKLLVNGVEWTSPIIDRNTLVSRPTVTLEFYMQAEQKSGLCARA